MIRGENAIIRNRNSVLGSRNRMSLRNKACRPSLFVEDVVTIVCGIWWCVNWASISHWSFILRCMNTYDAEKQQRACHWDCELDEDQCHRICK